MRRRSITAFAIIAILSTAVAMSFLRVQRGPAEAVTESGSAARSETSEPAAAERSTESERISLTMRRSDPDNARGSDRTNVTLAGNADLFLLRAATRRRIVPEDFTLGPLADRFATDSRVRSIREVATRLIDDFAAATPTGDAFVPEARSGLLRRLISDRDAGPTVERARIAAPQFVDSETAELEVVLFSREGRASAEIFLERVSGRWYVYGYTVDVDALARRYVRPQEKFEPSTSTRVMPGL